MKPGWVRVCPQCNSKEVEPRGMIGREAYSQNWVCLSCGFQSPLFPEITKEEAAKLPATSREFVSSRQPMVTSVQSKRSSRMFQIIALTGLSFFIALIVVMIYTAFK